jgi:hypothetical protein
VRSLILRAGDFFGPRPGNNWFAQGLVTPGEPVKAILSGARASATPGPICPTSAETFARLADREAELPAFARFHFDGQWDADGAAMTSAIRRVAGRAEGSGAPACPGPLLALMAPFNETLRELVEMKPFWRARTSGSTTAGWSPSWARSRARRWTSPWPRPWRGWTSACRRRLAPRA